MNITYDDIKHDVNENFHASCLKNVVLLLTCNTIFIGIRNIAAADDDDK